MGPIEAAIAAIESLKPGEQFSYRKIAIQYGCSRTSLARRHQGRSGSREAMALNQQSLHPQQEQELLGYIDRLTKQGLPPTRAIIRSIASQIAHKELGVHWVDRFAQRWPNRLISKWTTGMDNSRHKADSGKKYSLYFNLLHDKINQYKVETRHIYNMDEKGFMLGVVGHTKRIFSRASYKDRKSRSIIQDGSRDWITLIACVCADGSYLDPSLIYQSKSGSIQDSWLQGFDSDVHQAYISSSPSGWTNNEIGLAWLKQVFDRGTKAKARSSYRLLILDGHGSHLTMEFIDYYDQNKILLVVFPPHSTHTLQPLDVALFKPLSTAYSNEISSFMARGQGLVSMSKRDFFPLFYRAWEASFKQSTILRSFETTGLSPFNPEVILQRFAPTTSGSDSDSSAFSASDWRKIRTLIDRAVNYKESTKISQLNRTVHRLSSQAKLAQNEIRDLKEALINERKRRKRGKPLLLQEQEGYNGGAAFWSPRKVREAHDRQHQKDHDDQQLQLQKAEAIKLRKEAKVIKANEIKARRDARAEARIVRAQQKAKEAVDRAARKAAQKAQQRLQQALKTPQMGRRSSLKASTKLAVKKSVVGDRISRDQLPIQKTGLPAPRSRCARSIKLPAKYK
ncbi:pogo transposable element [Stemphylium lycopersici]|uniref:Pogo transposable element n=1 Tax=Stemphylium lycopersici TaxID=183478 RepID=A0A364MR90_STELY|nr:pogo transposable element [Stemphylium lycopersici]